MKIDKHESAEARVKKHLDLLLKDPDEWQALLDILNRRWHVKMMADRRRELGLTRAALAERLGLTEAAVEEFETEPYPDPRLSMLRRWEMALDLTHTWHVVEEIPEPEEAFPDD